MFLEDCLILENRNIAGQNYLMRLKAEKSIPASKAGQFFMIQCKNKLFIIIYLVFYLATNTSTYLTPHCNAAECELKNISI